MTETELKPIVESLIYLAEEPLTEASILAIVGKEHKELLKPVLARLIEEYQSVERGIEIKEIANGFKMATKAEHHEWARKYVKHHTPPMRLSLPALETLAVIAYKQPITVPEIQDIRGVNAVAVLKTLIDKNLVTPAGRKNVIGRPILYKTTKEFLLHFGLKNLNELPSLEEFEELAQSALGREAPEPSSASPVEEAASEGPPGAVTIEAVQSSEPDAQGRQPTSVSQGESVESSASTVSPDGFTGSLENPPLRGGSSRQAAGGVSEPSQRDSPLPPSKGESASSSFVLPGSDMSGSLEPTPEESQPMPESSSDESQSDQSLGRFAQSK
jgi:segregation and condensation protein B